MKATTISFKKLAGVLILLALSVLFAVNAAAAPVLSQRKAMLESGQTLVLAVYGQEGRVKWSSSKRSVASVTQAGLVTAKKKGTAKITAKCGKKKLTCIVKVTPVRVKGIKLKEESVSIRKGGTYKLTASIYPYRASDKRITWKSSKKGVVSVDKKGRIKAKKAGSATITAITKDGKKRASCTVEVKASGDTEVMQNDSFKEEWEDDEYATFKSGNTTEPVSRIAFPVIPAAHQAAGQHTASANLTSSITVPIYQFDDVAGYAYDGGISYFWSPQGMVYPMSRISFEAIGVAAGKFKISDFNGSNYGTITPTETFDLTYGGHQAACYQYYHPEWFADDPVGYQVDSLYHGAQSYLYILIPFTVTYTKAEDIEAAGADSFKGVIIIEAVRDNGKNKAEAMFTHEEAMSILRHAKIPANLDFVF